jgi:hypothetical protein
VALTLCSDLSAASWLTASDGSWERLVCFGPAGFPGYARSVGDVVEVKQLVGVHVG